MTTHTYHSVDVSVDRGQLRVGVWEPVAALNSDAVPTVLAVHGITATHQSWTYLPRFFPGVRVVAPDLRGRGRSNTLPGPYGMARHADDMSAVLSALEVGEASVVGHSMGGFVAVVLAHRHPELVQQLMLVDGGLPLEVPEGADPDALMEAVLGPAVRRLEMTFPNHAAYREFWSAHPAFSLDQVNELADYFDYDLEGSEGQWRSSSRIEAVTADQRELMTGESVLPALERLAVPATFVRAPRGPLDDRPFYRLEHVREWAGRLPSVKVVWASDVNHYTVVMSPAGAGLVAQHLAPNHKGVQR